MSITKVTDAGLDRSRIVTPIIINGDMQVAQRGTSKTGLTNGVAGYYTIDRFAFRETGDTSAVFTMSQDTDVPTGQGFAKSMKLDCTTADASPGSGDWVRIRYRVEGQDLQMIKKGTSSAETLTMSFWVKSSKTGTHIVSIYDDDNSGRIIAKAYTISSADTWEKKVITFAGDTTGTLTNDNSSAFRIEWHLLSGSDYQSGTLATSWQAYDATDLSVGQVNNADSTDNNWYITGVQMEIGEFDANTIPSFPFESFENNLRRCERYTRRLGDGLWGKASSTTAMVIQCPFFSPMRATPSISAISSAVKTSDVTAADYTSSAGISSSNINANGARLVVSSFSSLTSANMYILYDNSSYIALIDAEL